MHHSRLKVPSSIEPHSPVIDPLTSAPAVSALSIQSPVQEHFLGSLKPPSQVPNAIGI
jgi:hypothetical protein